MAAHFDPAGVGEVHGRVTWADDLPQVPPFRVRANQQPGSPPAPRLIRPNPNQPIIDPTTRRIASAVVFLRGINPARARPWNHPPVRIEMRDRRYQIRQGEATRQVGIVRQGDAVTMVSRDYYFYSLHAGGASYFTLTFPDPEQPLTRTLPTIGLVELSSGAACYWMRAYLLVANHPYYAPTDPQGRFHLDQVPPGRYQLVCWLPSWQVDKQERDPETGQVARVYFRPPLEITRTITIEAGKTLTCDFTLNRRTPRGR
jgi:hypothetical protein